MKSMHTLYPDQPSIALHDPLAELLGAGEGYFTYRFMDAVKLSGHACPTVAGAFLLTIHGLKSLYEECTPVRGQIRITAPGPVDAGTNGPMSQVMTLITGAAADNGFQGLAGKFARNGLLSFGNAGDGRWIFTRTDTEKCVGVSYDPSSIPPDPDMKPLMQQIMQDDADCEAKRRFAELWRERVVKILEDDGKATITLSYVC